MIHPSTVIAGAGVALCAAAFGPFAAAQEFRATGGGGGGGGPRTVRFQIGFDVMAEGRELAATSYDETWIGTQPAPPSASGLGSRNDEEMLEHRIQYSAREQGALISLGGVYGEDARFGLRFGPVQVDLDEDVRAGSWLYGGTNFSHIHFGAESKIGFAGGLFGDYRYRVPGGPVFVGVTFDFLVGQVAIDNTGVFLAGPGTTTDGEYAFARTALAGRVGFTQQGLSPFLGVSLSAYAGSLSLETKPPPTAGSNITKQEAEFASRNLLRVLIGCDIAKGGDTFARFEFGIGKPGADWIFSLTAALRM